MGENMIMEKKKISKNMDKKQHQITCSKMLKYLYIFSQEDMMHSLHFKMLIHLERI